MSEEIESALAELTEAREKLEAVRATLMQIVTVPHTDQGVMRQARAKLERMDAEAAGVERLVKEVASQGVNV